MGLKKGKITANTSFTDDVVEITLETEENLDFKAGQFITIKVDDQVPPCFRAYSIASAPNKENNEIKLCLKVVEGGRGSHWLESLKVDNEINFIGPSGNFVFKGEKDKILFIATGTGITPFNSMIEDELKKGNTKKMHLLFGVRYIKNIFYKDFFNNLANKYQNFTYDIVLSRPEDNSWQGKTGRVTGILQEMALDLGNTEVYICGLKVMISDVAEILKEKNFPEEQIHLEKYD